MSKAYDTSKRKKSNHIISRLSTADWLAMGGIALLLILTGAALLNSPTSDTLLSFVGTVIQALNFIRSVSQPKQ